MQPNQYIRKGDIIGCSVDVEVGTIEYYKNGQPLGICFQEGMSFRKNKVKIYPLLQLYKCKISVFQQNDFLVRNKGGNNPQQQQ